jgi:hypothetical protein
MESGLTLVEPINQQADSMNVREGLHRLDFLVTAGFYGSSAFFAARVAFDWWHIDPTLEVNRP